MIPINGLGDLTKALKRIFFPDVARKIAKAALTQKESLTLDQKEIIKLHLMLENYESIWGRLFDAKIAYDEPGERYDKRMKNALHALTFSDGKKKTRRDPSVIFWDYIMLISGVWKKNGENTTSPISKEEAIKILQQKYEHNSYETTYKMLQRALKELNQNRKGLLPPFWPEI